MTIRWELLCKTYLSTSSYEQQMRLSHFWGLRVNLAVVLELETYLSWGGRSAFAGPLMQHPRWSEMEPSQGQSNVASSGFHFTTHFMCEQIATFPHAFPKGQLSTCSRHYKYNIMHFPFFSQRSCERGATKQHFAVHPFMEIPLLLATAHQ